MNIINRCLTDIIRYAKECHTEIILAVAAVCIIRTLYELWKKQKGVGTSSLRSFLASLFLWGMDSAYVAYAIYVTLGMRYIGMRHEVNLIPFQAVLANPAEIPMMIENTLLFIPFGILFPLTFPRLSGAKAVIGTAGLASFGIEMLQLIFRCGKTELDDIILNVLGAALGYLILRGKKGISSG